MEKDLIKIVVPALLLVGMIWLLLEAVALSSLGGPPAPQPQPYNTSSIKDLKEGECTILPTRDECITVFEDREENVTIVQCDAYRVCNEGGMYNYTKFRGPYQAFNSTCGCPIDLIIEDWPGG